MNGLTERRFATGVATRVLVSVVKPWLWSGFTRSGIMFKKKFRVTLLMVSVGSYPVRGGILRGAAKKKKGQKKGRVV